MAKEHGKAKKKHLHEIRSVYGRDGSVVHHHTYKDDADSDYTHPERGPMATSRTPEEAGQHVAEMFAMNGGGQQGEPDGDEAAQGGGQAEPAAAAQPAAGAPEEGE